jgi:multidrug efflux pump subunit AcrA (membrane-fusion protein)
MRRWIGRTERRLILVGLVIALGVGLGMGLRAAIAPHMPAWLAHLMGKPAAETTQGAAGAESGRKIAFWKSSMIPNFVSPKPGVDPMGMALIPVYVDELSEERFITLSGAQMENVGLRTAVVAQTKAVRVVRSVGRVDYAEPLLGDVTLKVSGWIEKLPVNYVGQRVEKGQALVSLYSPELVNAEDEYLLQLQTSQPGRRGRGQDVFNAYDKLRYWDVPEDEIAAIRRAGRAKKRIMFRSPFHGWVIEKSAYEGMYMKAGTRFFRIADLSTVWVYVYVYEYQLAWLKVDQPARLTLPFRPAQVFEGKVVYIYPDVDPRTRQIRVRLEFANPQLHLKPEMYANVQIATGSGRRMAVPLDAIIYTGAEKSWQGSPHRAGYAYVQVKPGKFEAREVIFGQDLEDGKVEVLSGLRDGEHVVVDGQFLLDSERRVKQANLAMFMKGRKGP